MLRKIVIAGSMVAALGLISMLPAEDKPVASAGDASAADLYAKKCAMCHGKDGVAKEMAKGSANLGDPAWQKSTSREAVEKIITDGKGKMPKYQDKMSPEQIKAVAAHVLSLKPA